MSETLQAATKLHWYFTCSLPMHNHPVYSQVLEHIHANFPYMSSSPLNEVIEARGKYTSGRDWLDKWPIIRNTQVNGGLLFMLDESGFIGKGVHTEVQDVLNKGLPVYVVDYDGYYYLITTLVGKPFIDGPDWQHYTHISIEVLQQEIEQDKRAHSEMQAEMHTIKQEWNASNISGPYGLGDETNPYRSGSII